MGCHSPTGSTQTVVMVSCNINVKKSVVYTLNLAFDIRNYASGQWRNWRKIELFFKIYIFFVSNISICTTLSIYTYCISLHLQKSSKISYLHRLSYTNRSYVRISFHLYCTPTENKHEIGAGSAGTVAHRYIVPAI